MKTHKYKKVGWNNQPTKCPLLKPESFSAYQMSITPKFKTITYISTSCDVVKKTHSEVLLIGGGQDNSSNNLPTSTKRLQRCGTKTVLLFDEKEKHYMLIHQKERIIDFLNHELELD